LMGPRPSVGQLANLFPALNFHTLFFTFDNQR